MSLIVVGTYVCALYGAFGTPVNARPPSPPRAVVTTAPAAAATHAVANIADIAEPR